MLYHLYQAANDAILPGRLAALTVAGLLRPINGGGALSFLPRAITATLDVFDTAATTHLRPAFGISSVAVGNEDVAVTEQVVFSTPFADLLRFRKDSETEQPRLLVVAPMSGHFATLLRGTIRTLLQDHDVYLTDWKNARDIPVSKGAFGFDDYVEHIIDFLEVLGPGSHVLAVCQPTVPVLAAVSVMAASGSRAQPRSMTLMAGPIDTQISPTEVNRLACGKPYEWFERNMIATVPERFGGAGRRVYPGFVQLSAFIAMNRERHTQAFIRQFRNLVTGEIESAAAHRRFYDEYLAVMDLPAEFFLETVKKIFQEAELARGVLTYRGEPVRPSAIRRTSLLTVEGELDDICAIGQTMAALDLCSGITPAMKQHHLQTGVGHYGVFNGRRWAREIYPRVRDTVQAAA